MFNDHADLIEQTHASLKMNKMLWKQAQGPALSQVPTDTYILTDWCMSIGLTFDSKLRRQTQVLVHVCGRGFKSHF